MKNYRFYAAMPEARKSKSASKANPHFPWTVAALRKKSETDFRFDLVAVILDDRGRPFYQGSTTNIDAFVTAIEDEPYSYCVGGVSRDWLAKRCTRIPEELARKLSPQLFTRLES